MAFCSALKVMKATTLYPVKRQGVSWQPLSVDMEPLDYPTVTKVLSLTKVDSLLINADIQFRV